MSFPPPNYTFPVYAVPQGTYVYAQYPYQGVPMVAGGGMLPHQFAMGAFQQSGFMSAPSAMPVVTSTPIDASVSTLNPYAKPFVPASTPSVEEESTVVPSGDASVDSPIPATSTSVLPKPVTSTPATSTSAILKPVAIKVASASVSASPVRARSRSPLRLTVEEQRLIDPSYDPLLSELEAREEALAKQKLIEKMKLAGASAKKSGKSSQRGHKVVLDFGRQRRQAALHMQRNPLPRGTGADPFRVNVLGPKRGRAESHATEPLTSLVRSASADSSRLDDLVIDGRIYRVYLTDHALRNVTGTRTEYDRTEGGRKAGDAVDQDLFSHQIKKESIEIAFRRALPTFEAIVKAGGSLDKEALKASYAGPNSISNVSLEGSVVTLFFSVPDDREVTWGNRRYSQLKLVCDLNISTRNIDVITNFLEG